MILIPLFKIFVIFLLEIVDLQTLLPFLRFLMQNRNHRCAISMLPDINLDILNEEKDE
jgi:hypothetical protein